MQARALKGLGPVISAASSRRRSPGQTGQTSLTGSPSAHDLPSGCNTWLTDRVGDWTAQENDLVVGAYLQMLDAELRGEHYVKSQVNEETRRHVHRSRGSVEYKFRNVSAALVELNHPYVRGYKPAVNFQESLRDAVLRGLIGHPELRESALAQLTREPNTRAEFSWLLSDAPTVEFSPHRQFLRRAIQVDFVQIDAANRSLGIAGERAVVALERERLSRAGLDRLARSVRHVSLEDGDGLGYDIRSFTADGDEKFIEVKTTRMGPQWPMLITSNEVRFSKEEETHFHLYRVYDFDAARRGLFQLAGDVE